MVEDSPNHPEWAGLSLFNRQYQAWSERDTTVTYPGNSYPMASFFCITTPPKTHFLICQNFFFLTKLKRYKQKKKFIDQPQLKVNYEKLLNLSVLQLPEV